MIVGKVAAMTRVYYALWLEYRAELLLWALTGVLPLIMMGVWMKAGAGGQFPMTPREFARYFIAVFLVRQLSSVWVIWEFEYDMVQGLLSPWLLQPIDPVWRYLGQHLGERLARLPMLAGLLALFFALYPQSFWVPTWQQLSLGLAVTAFSFMLRFLIQYSTSMMTFFTERASSLEQLFTLLYLFFSGYLAPLKVYPPAVRAAILWTPFPYLIDFPATLLTGQAQIGLGRGLAMMAGWSLLFLIINRLLWRRGLRHYSGMGA